MAGGGDVRIVGGNQRVKDGVASVTGNALHVRIVAGTVTIQEPLEVDTAQLENAVVAAAHPVFPAGVERDDVLSTLGVADGDWTELRVDDQGALWVRDSLIKAILSGSTSGQPINVTTGPAATLHTVPASTIDCITLYASNPNTTNLTITLTWGTGGLSLVMFVPCLETVSLTVSLPLEATEVVTAVVSVGNAHVVGFVERRAA